MNEYAALAPISSTNPPKPGSPDGETDFQAFAIRDATAAPLIPDADVSDEDDDTGVSTGLNPDPDYEKLDGAAGLMMPDEDDDDELSSDDADDDRV